MTATRSKGCVVFAISMLLIGCSDPGTETSAQLPHETTTSRQADPRIIRAPAAIRDRLRTDAVGLRAVPEVVTAPGEVTLDLKQVAKITSRIEGQIEQIHVQLGDRVKQGQLLVAIGSLHLDRLIEEYLVVKAQAEVAESNWQRTKKLRQDDIVPERKLIEDRGRHRETKARYQHIREKLLKMGLSTTEILELERGPHGESHRYTLSAPISGTVVTQNAVLGQGVAPGTELFEVVDTSRVWVFANLPIEQARKFKEGDRGKIAPKGGDAVTASLTYIAPVADKKTRTIRVRFEVGNPRGLLKPGEYVDVILTHPGSPTVAVSASAVTTVDQVRGVFVERDSAYRFVPIEVGREGGGWIEVRSGVNEGDRVVTEGVLDLKNVLLKEHIGSGE